MTLKDLQEQIYNPSNRHSYSSLDDLILEIINSYAKEMCRVQREICAQNVEEGRSDVQRYDACIDSPLPKELN